MSDYQKNLDRAARLCSAREKCSHEVEVKLHSWGMSEQEIQRALRFLEEQKFIDDTRYAGYFVRDKLQFNQWGKLKIRHALRQKHVDEKIVDEALQHIDPEHYRGILDALLEKKVKSLGKEPPPQRKAKLMRFAAQRGFTSGEVYEAMDRLSFFF